MNIYGEYFYGNKISAYGLEHGFVDYGTLAKAFDAVLNNSIMEKTYDIGYWEQESGFINNDYEIAELEDKIAELVNMVDTLTDENKIAELEDKIAELEDARNDLEYENDTCTAEIFQYFIVDDRGADLLKEINEIVFYNDELDMYVWGVTHWGTSWDYVLTNIPCNTGEF